MAFVEARLWRHRISYHFALNVFTTWSSVDTGDCSLLNPPLRKSKTRQNITAWNLMNFASFILPISTTSSSLWAVEFPSSPQQWWISQVKKNILCEQYFNQTRSKGGKRYKVYCIRQTYYRGGIPTNENWQNKRHVHWAPENNYKNGTTGIPLQRPLEHLFHCLLRGKSLHIFPSYTLPPTSQVILLSF